MEIVNSYWSNKNEQLISENQFLNHVNKFEVNKVFIGTQKIENFKISIENDRMILRYSLRKNSSLKYYANLLNHSIALNKSIIVFLQDKNWLDYKNRIITEETKQLLNN